MGVFGAVLFGRSKPLFWVLGPLLLGGLATVTFPLNIEDGFHLAAVLVCDLAGLFLLLCLWPYHEIPGVQRLLTATVAVAFTYYVLDAWFPGLFPRKGSPASVGMASAGFLTIGVPCWKYVLLGRFTSAPPPTAKHER